MSAMASKITSLTIVYSSVYSGADQRKHQSSASLAFVRGIQRWPVNSPHKGSVTRKCFHLSIMYHHTDVVTGSGIAFLLLHQTPVTSSVRWRYGLVERTSGSLWERPVYGQPRPILRATARCTKLMLCLANHRAGYFSNLACDWLSIVWAYSEQETENGPWSVPISFMVASLALEQSYHCPRASEVTLKNVGKFDQYQSMIKLLT